MNRWTRILFVVTVVLFSSASAFAMPDYLEIFRNDPFRNPNRDGCDTCHMSPAGGDERNPFGQEFERASLMITTLMRAQFPDRFVYPVSRVSDTLTIHFSDPANKQIVIEANGTKTLVDVERRTVAGQPAATPGAAPAAPAATTSAPAANPAQGRPAVSEVRVDAYAREGAFFGGNVVNLPNGKPLPGGGWEFFIGHRFLQDIKDAGLGGLFGFDSSAIVAYGVRAGLTNRVGVGVMRSNLSKVISLTSTLQVSRQSNEVPLTVQVRGGVDGKENFGLCDTQENFACQRDYSPFLQATVVRTFKDRLSVLASPIFAFNTRNEKTFVPPAFLFGNEHNHTISLGLGVGIRFMPSVSLVGEYIPRLDGFRGEFKDRPGVSIGLQKSTFRHTFELVVSRQEPITPARVAFQGTDTFRIGFNIYRRLR
jgi:hypothetical protein